MNDLENELRDLQNDWTGQAKGQYEISKQRWDTAIYEMLTVLGQTSQPASPSPTPTTSPPTSAARSRSRY